MNKKNILQKLYKIQIKLKAPKENEGRFGKSRSAEDILESLKPILKEYNCIIIMNENVNVLNNAVESDIFKGLDKFGKTMVTKTQTIRHYVESTVTLYDVESGESIESKSIAREHFSKKGNDDSQITGATISYARKYALGGLFIIDDTKDADSGDNTK